MNNNSGNRETTKGYMWNVWLSFAIPSSLHLAIKFTVVLAEF